MDNAALYHKANSMQCWDAETVIKDHIKKIQWKEAGGDRILDIGCGDGYVMMNILAPKLPKNMAKLTGLDISIDMIKHAAKKYSTHAVDFMTVDFSQKVPSELVEEYDHAFSFNCLHWIQNQRIAMKNIYDILTPGGSLILTMIAKNSIYDVYRTLRASKKWSRYMDDLDMFISPYHDSKCPSDDFEKLLHETGFTCINVEYNKKVFYFENLDILKKSVFAVTPFIKRIPTCSHDDFFNDYLDIVRSLDLVEGGNNNLDEDVKIKAPYYSLVSYAKK